MKTKVIILLSCFIVIISFFISACSKDSKEMPPDLVPMLMIDESLYIDTGEQEPMGDSGCISKTITSTVDGTNVPTKHEQSNFGCVGNNYVLSDHSAVVFINDNWYRFEKEKTQLSLDRVIELSKKGNELSWDDFEEYTSTDIGSGLYIRLYEIDVNFNLLIGGGGTDQTPMYIRLEKKDNQEQFIDIRTDDVGAFIGGNP